MKNAFLLLSIFAFSCASAQIELRNTRFGFTAGPDVSAVKNAHNPSDKRFGFVGGVVAEIPLNFRWASDQFYIQPELLYMQAGENGRESLNEVYQANYFSIPIWFKAYFSDNESSFFAMAGPRFAFLTNQKVKNPSRPIYAVDQFGKAAKFDFALAAGVGYSFNRKFEITGRYELGISNAYPQLTQDFDNTGDPNALSHKNQHVISLMVSYIFD